MKNRSARRNKWKKDGLGKNRAVEGRIFGPIGLEKKIPTD